MRNESFRLLQMTFVTICVLYATRVTKRPCCLLGLTLLAPLITVKVCKEKK